MTALAKIGTRGRTTIPKAIRDAGGLRGGDGIAFTVDGDRLVLQKVAAGQHGYSQGFGRMTGEWLSPKEAWRSL